jgi:hypothetical protein
MNRRLAAAKKRLRAQERKALARIQRRILSAAQLLGPYGQECLDESTQRRLANLESERRRRSE